MTFKERMASYTAYHRDPRNKLTHLFGVPVVFWSPMIALNWVHVPAGDVAVPLGFLVYAAFMVWYFTLDLMLGLVMTTLTVPIAYGCDRVARMPFNQSLAVFGALTVGGWAIQLLGHYYERRRPALVDNLLQSLMGPLFVVLEILFFVGIRRELEREVHELSAAYLPKGR